MESRTPILPFALAAALFLLVAGAMIVSTGVLSLSSHWSSLTLSLTHLVTLGFITMGLVGVLYPLTSSVTGVPVPAPRLVWVVLVSLFAGVASLCWGTAQADSRFVFGAIGAMGIMAPIFVTQVALMLRRSAEHDDSTRAIRLALIGFALAASLGLWLAHGHGGMKFPGPRGLWLQVHLCVGLLGWVGGAVCAVSWRVLPSALGLDPPSPLWAARIGRLLGFGILAPSLLLMMDYFELLPIAPDVMPWVAALLTAPAWLAVWGLHPLLLGRTARDSAKGEGVPRPFLMLGLACAPAVALLSLLALGSGEPRLAMLFGWLALFGWAGALVHGMLSRSLSPLRAAAAAGGAIESAPGGLDGVFSDPSAYFGRIGVLFHVLTLMLGVISILLSSDLLARLTGAGVIVTALMLIAALVSGSGGSVQVAPPPT